jgi:hypothetical protein
MLNRKLFSTIFVLILFATSRFIFSNENQIGIDVKQVTENADRYEGLQVTVIAYVLLKKTESRALFSCDSSNDLFRQKYIYLDLFSEEPNNKNHLKLNEEANAKYEKYSKFDQHCARVKGVFHISQFKGREVGTIVLQSISRIEGGKAR